MHLPGIYNHAQKCIAIYNYCSSSTKTLPKNELGQPQFIETFVIILIIPDFCPLNKPFLF
eukprot:UN06936